MNELRALFLGPPRLKLAVAESLTCGRVQAAIGAISGASDFFLGGITAYALEEKVKLLGVDRAAAGVCNSVSAAVAAQMAVGALRLFGSDVAAATTGYAEPDVARGIVHPQAFWAVARRHGEEVAVVREVYLERPGLARVAMQEAVAAAVLAALADVVREMRAAGR